MDAIMSVIEFRWYNILNIYFNHFNYSTLARTAARTGSKNCNYSLRNQIAN